MDTIPVNFKNDSEFGNHWIVQDTNDSNNTVIDKEFLPNEIVQANLKTSGGGKYGRARYKKIDSRNWIGSNLVEDGDTVNM